MDDLISRQKALDHLRKRLIQTANNNVGFVCDAGSTFQDASERVKTWLDEVPSIDAVPQWIPIKWHDCTDEDREKYGFSNDIVAVFDCEMPDDDQPILVTTSHGYVNQDVCYIDDGYSLDSGWDWIDDIKAWMPLPKPYEAERKEE